MTKYWCVNFELVECLEHGIENDVWVMGYQYNKRANYGNRKTRITVNWRALKSISPGDKFVAYLPTDTFFATGTVREPRRQRTNADSIDDIEEYLKRRKSHKGGYIYFKNSVVYEDFTDDCHHYPVRIDVQEWENYVPGGVVVKVVNNIPIHKRQNAVFQISKRVFDRIARTLATAEGAVPTPQEPVSRKRKTAEPEVAEDEAVVEAVEKSQAKRQGFLIDSKTRKALDDHAMAAAERYFRSEGYNVENHSKGNPYDLLCTKKKKKLHVEVKGTQTAGDGIVLTPREVQFARSHREKMALFILHSVKVAEGKILNDGERRLILPWDVDQGHLKPVSFVYDVPGR
jgi:hypothetical protein